MSGKKVFSLTVEFNIVAPHLYGKWLQKVEQDIVALAQAENETVVFHKFVDEDQLGGSMPVLVEASEELAEKMKSITHVTHVGAPHLPTRPRITGIK